MTGLITTVELLNTLDERRFGAHAQRADSARDALRSPSDLREWLIDHGLLPPSARVSRDDLELALSFRNGLRAHLGSTQRDPGSGVAIDEMTRQMPLIVSFDGEGPRLLHAGRPVRQALAALLEAVVLAGARGEWPRLKLCAAEDCRWAFYDGSRNRLGRWCSMNVCGNREKTRTYRMRRR